jgi:hypothetical protein
VVADAVDTNVSVFGQRICVPVQSIGDGLRFW